MNWLGMNALMLLSTLCAQEKPAFEAASIHANNSSEIGQSFFDPSGAGRLVRAPTPHAMCYFILL